MYQKNQLERAWTMKSNFKIKRRRFELKFCLPFPNYICEQYAKEVIEGIEQDELLVFDPKDREGLDEVLSEDGSILILEKAKIPISIKEWLPVGCQYIRYAIGEEIESDKVWALYRNNASRVLWPSCAEYKPEGPAAFYGEILISSALATSYDKPFFEDKFKGIVAHELVHVFNTMRFLVPAFMDWRNFWHIFVGEGAGELLQSNLGSTGSFINSYGQKNELLEMKEHWKSQAKAWFDAMRQNEDA